MKQGNILLLAVLLSASYGAGAQNLSPRAYWPAPVGTRIGTIGMAYSSGDQVPDATLPITGVDSSVNQYFIGYRHTVALAGRTTNLLLELPYSDGNTKVLPELGEDLRREYSGMGDLAATISVNLLGAPTMTREGLQQLRLSPRPVLGVSLKVVAPTGDYDNDRVINVGANRWAARLEVGYIHPIKKRWLVEAELGSWFFQDNDDFLGRRREQDSIVALQCHLVHRFRPGLWASLDLNGYKGGRSTIAGRKLDDLQRDSKIGATLVFPFARGSAFKFSYSYGSTNDSDESFELFQLSYSRVF